MDAQFFLNLQFQVVITPEIFIDASDFRLEDSPDYFGLAPGKWLIEH